MPVQSKAWFSELLLLVKSLNYFFKLDRHPRKMTEKGRQFTLESRRKAALDGKRKLSQGSSV